MAMLRRLDGPVSALHVRVPESPSFQSRASDWPAQALHLTADSRVEAARCRLHARETREEQDRRQKEERRAKQVQHQIQLAHNAEMNEAMALELRKRHSQDVRWEWQIEQAKASNPQLRNLHQSCMQEQASAERALQLLLDEIADEESRQHEVAALRTTNVAYLKAEEDAHNNEQARRSHGKKFLQDVSSQAASSRTRQRAEADAERESDYERVERVAANIRAEDLQRYAIRKHAQSTLHAALDQQVEEQRQRSITQNKIHLVQENKAAEYNRAKQAFADKLCHERQAAEASRERVLHAMSMALRTHNLESRIKEEVREEFEREEFEKARQMADELRLRNTLQRRQECIQAYQDSIRSFEHRREAAIAEDSRERHQLMEQFAKDEKLELISEQRRRMKKVAYAREVEAMMKERQEKREQERHEELQEIKAKLEEEERVAAIIREERDRLLHAYGLADVGSRLTHILA